MRVTTHKFYLFNAEKHVKILLQYFVHLQVYVLVIYIYH